MRLARFRAAAQARPAASCRYGQAALPLEPRLLGPAVNAPGLGVAPYPGYVPPLFS